MFSQEEINREEYNKMIHIYNLKNLLALIANYDMEYMIDPEYTLAKYGTNYKNKLFKNAMENLNYEHDPHYRHLKKILHK
jgi:hypothetical protein